MTYSEAVLQAAHAHCTSNKTEIGNSRLCSCFYCCETFPSAAIERWLPMEDTAFCPECQIDSVIGDASGLPINDPEFLKAMHVVWFERTVTIEEMAKLSRSAQPKRGWRGLLDLLFPKDSSRA